MVDKVIFSTDLDTTRGLAEDGRAYVKVDGSSIGFDLEGRIKSLNSTSITPIATGHAIATVAVNSIPVNIYETISTLVANTPTCSFTYNNENGVPTVVDGNLFLSKLAGNSLIVGTDGGLYFTSSAAFNSSQMLSGDNTGTVSITMTPIVTGNTTSYQVKASTKLSPTTPSSKNNLIKNAATIGAGIYVDPADVISSLGLKLVVNKVTPSIELRDMDNNMVSSIPVLKVTNLAGSQNRAWIDLS
jgi:hypothetical protein